MFKITLEFGGKVVKDYDFTKSAITIGRELDNDIVIDNLGVSRHHCKVEEKPGDIHVLTDLGSNNGTFVAGKKVTTYNLNDGDKIALGKYTLVYHSPKQKAESQKERKPDLMDLPTMEIGAEDLKQPEGAAAPADPPKASGPMTMEMDADEMERMQAERASEVNAYLQFNIGQQTQNYPLQKSYHFIGSSSKADFKASGWRIMPRHTLLVRDAGGYSLVNLSPKKPTKLNGKAVDQQRLKNSDVITVGKNDFTYFIGKPK